jgi:hypothetical protein
MAEYDNTNRWVLSRNEKRRNDKDAEFTGEININGVDYWLNGWVKERKKDGSKFFSGTTKPKNPSPSSTKSGTLSEQLGDDIPF